MIASYFMVDKIKNTIIIYLFILQPNFSQTQTMIIRFFIHLGRGAPNCFSSQADICIAQNSKLHVELECRGTKRRVLIIIEHVVLYFVSRLPRMLWVAGGMHHAHRLGLLQGGGSNLDPAFPTRGSKIKQKPDRDLG